MIDGEDILKGYSKRRANQESTEEYHKLDRIMTSIYDFLYWYDEVQNHVLSNIFKDLYLIRNNLKITEIIDKYPMNIKTLYGYRNFFVRLYFRHKDDPPIPHNW